MGFRSVFYIQNPMTFQDGENYTVPDYKHSRALRTGLPENVCWFDEGYGNKPGAGQHSVPLLLFRSNFKADETNQ